MRLGAGGCGGRDDDDWTIPPAAIPPAACDVLGLGIVLTSHYL